MEVSTSLQKKQEARYTICQDHQREVTFLQDHQPDLQTETKVWQRPATVQWKALKQHLAYKDGTYLLDEAWIVQGDD